MAEVISIVPKTIFIFLAVYLNLVPKYGILIFAISQILYSLTLMLIFFFKSENKSLFLQPISNDGKITFLDKRSK